MTRARLRVLLPLAAALAIVVPLAWMWQASLLPDTYAVTEMGYVDMGGGPAVSMPGHGTGHGTGHGGGHGDHGSSTGTTSVEDLVGPRTASPTPIQKRTSGHSVPSSEAITPVIEA